MSAAIRDIFQVYDSTRKGVDQPENQKRFGDYMIYTKNCLIYFVPIATATGLYKAGLTFEFAKYFVSFFGFLAAGFLYFYFRYRQEI